MSRMPERLIVVAPSKKAVENIIRDLGGNVHQLLNGGRATIRVVVPNNAEDVSMIRGLQLQWCVLPDFEADRTWLVFMEMTTRHRQRGFHELLAAHLCWRLWHDC